MEFHPYAELFPMLADAEFEALAEDIQHQGLLSPIVIHEGKILDGRNRFRACEIAGIEPTFEPYAGDDPLAYVVAVNMLRRHLTIAQRAFLASHIATMRQGARTDLASQEAKSQCEAAEMLAVGRSTVQRAKEIEEHGIPELVDLARSGNIGLKEAAEISKLTPEEQARVLAAPKSIRADTGGNDEWYSPVRYAEMARDVMGGIDLDPASCERGQQNVQADRYYMKEDDGLAQPWAGRVWMNPPYSKGLIDQFVEKLCGEFEGGNISEAIVLVSNFTDTAWFHRLLTSSTCFCFTRGRIKFEGPDGVGNSPTNGHVFFYLGRKAERFRDVFSSVGAVAQLCDGAKVIGAQVANDDLREVVAA